VSDTVGRFSAKVADYDRYRPGYPSAAFDAILGPDGFERPRDPGFEDPLVVDVGAGTGQATRGLALRVRRLIAIEPNADMRASLVANCPGVDVRDTTAEHTGLAAGSVDVVAMFQAFQWCDGAAALAEFARITRPGGRIGIVWNMPDRRDPFTAAYEDLVDHHGDATLAEALPAGAGTAEQFLASPLLVNARKAVVKNEQRLDAEGFRGRIGSVSYLPPPGPALDAILTAGDRIFARFARGDETLCLVYRTVVYVAERR